MPSGGPSTQPWWGSGLARIDALVPARLSIETEAGARARMFVRALVATFLFSLLMTVIYLPTGVWGQVVLNGGVSAFMVVMLVLLQRGVKLDWLIQWSLGVPSVAFAAGGLVQTPFDLSSVFFLSVTPLIASFVLGWRWAVVWFVAMLGLGALTMYLGFHGYTLPEPDDTPQLTSMVNFTFLLALVALIGIGVHELRTRAYAAVDLASRAKSAFLANMSHEIRTPMNGVLGLTEVMLKEPMTPLQRERLELIHRSGEVLVALLDDVLDLARIEAGRFTIALEPTSLTAMMDDVRALFTATAQARHLELALELQPGVPGWVRTDQTRLRQVLFNLTSNALKFTKQGRVALRVRPSSERAGAVLFEVCDTGIGIDSSTLRRLFVPFQQADSSTTRRYGGSGLGLAISKQLVELLGGELRAESTPGVGSRFFFTLPLQAVSPAASGPSPVPARPAGGGRVLVVDDNAINLKVASSLVEKAGFTVATATNGREAVEAVTAGRFDLVLMDCHMPEMDGFEAARRIRALPHGGAVPIVALTASTFPEDVAACQAAGMNECLAKPVTFKTLAASLERMTGVAVGAASS